MCHLAKGNREQAIADFKIQAEKDIELIRKGIIAVSLSSKQLNELKENPRLGTSPSSPAPQQQPSKEAFSKEQLLPTMPPKYTGKGKFTFSDGCATLEGDFINGSLHGKGKITSKEGVILTEGDFVKGLLHGKGKEVKPTDDIYEGCFVNGDLHGKGKITFSNGDVFEGDFVDGDGKGTMTYANGKVSKGKWDGEFKKSLFG
jgi:hypothetical protein